MLDVIVMMFIFVFFNKFISWGILFLNLLIDIIIVFGLEDIVKKYGKYRVILK